MADINLIEVFAATFVGSFVGCAIANLISSLFMGLSNRIWAEYERKRSEIDKV